MNDTIIFYYIDFVFSINYRLYDELCYLIPEARLGAPEALGAHRHLTSAPGVTHQPRHAQSPQGVCLGASLTRLTPEWSPYKERASAQGPRPTRCAPVEHKSILDLTHSVLIQPDPYFKKKCVTLAWFNQFWSFSSLPASSYDHRPLSTRHQPLSTSKSYR